MPPSSTGRPLAPTRVACALACLLVAGCSSGPYGLTVELRTDFESGVEVATADVDLEIDPTSAVQPRTTLMSAQLRRGMDLVAGLRIAEYDDVPSGTHTVHVRLRDAGGRVVATRNVLVTVSGQTTMVVLMTRNCGGVTCPGSGDDPGNTECLDGRCVPPDCNPDVPGSCGDPTCTEDSECPGSDCAAGTCVSGTCLVAWADDNCSVGMRCTVVGCVPDDVIDAGPPFDGGPDYDAGRDAGRDAGPPTCDITACDDGIACTEPTCVSGSCMNFANNALCDDGIGCTSDVCSGTGCTHTPNDGMCNDSVACTDDSCGGSGCVNTPVDSRCDDGVGCTNDNCGAGGCSNPPVNSRCNDGNGCTDDDCTPGGCSNPNNSNTCDDGRFCNGADRCGGGSCSQHAGNPCNVGGDEICSE